VGGQRRAAGAGESVAPRGWPAVALLAAAASAIYLALALAGDLRQRFPELLAAYAALSGAMLLAWRLVRREGRLLPWAAAAAVLFRLAALSGAPALSDDVQRYVWDGRVQLHGVHPYRHAPLDPEVAPLRDRDFDSLNHPAVKTIYPPLAQLFFMALAGLGAGPPGFKLASGLLDCAVILALDRLLRRRALPRDRLILYAWNPLAVLETAGSGHLEPLGVLLVILAGTWIIERRPVLATLALAASVQVKLLPVVLAPALLRRVGLRAGLPAFGLGLLALALPYAATGPAIGGGSFDYAERWEHNAVIYDAVEHGLERVDAGSRLGALLARLHARLGDAGLPWEWLHHRAAARDLARVGVALAATAWVLAVCRRRLDLPAEALLATGGVLLLSPTLHPWYLLWVLPWAAAGASRGWLLLAGTVVLSYANPAGDVPVPLKVLEFGPPLALAAWDRWRSAADRRGGA